MKRQIKHLSLWVILLLLNASLAYADAPPVKPFKTLSKKEIRLRKRLKCREARKLKKQAKKVRRLKRLLNSKAGQKLLKKRKGKKLGASAILVFLAILFLIIGIIVLMGEMSLYQLVGGFLLIGIVVALLLAALFNKIINDMNKEENRKG